MAYLPSHQELRDHPKTRKAARKLGTDVPATIGHLHLLWWWALDHAPDGDLAKYDDDDLADAAMFDGDPETFVAALTDCGPGASDGFLDADRRLHDWDEYGGKYGQRVAAARKAATVRWQSETDADALRPHSDGSADAMPEQCDDDAAGNAEERREYKTLAPDKPPREPDRLWEALAEIDGIDWRNTKPTRNEAARLGKAAKEIRGAGGTPEQVPRAAQAFRRKFDGATVTAMAVANRWSELTSAPSESGWVGGVSNG